MATALIRSTATGRSGISEADFFLSIVRLGGSAHTVEEISEEKHGCGGGWWESAELGVVCGHAVGDDVSKICLYITYGGGLGLATVLLALRTADWLARSDRGKYCVSLPLLELTTYTSRD